MMHDESLQLATGDNASESDDFSESHDEAFPPLPTGQSSPCSPIEFDEATGLRTVAHKKSVNFELGGSERKLSDNDERPTMILAPIPQVPPTSPTSKNRVSFSSSVLHKEVRHINDFAKEEVAMLWMTMQDYLMIKAVVKSTVAMMMKGESMDEAEWCPRGLESRTRAGAKIRSRAKLRTRSAVLNEQDMQREEGFEDPQFIAMACMEESELSRASARSRGVQDERCIQEYLADSRHLVALYKR